MFTFIFSIGYLLLGSIMIGLFRIKTPTSTPDGKANPEEAWMAWFLMLGAWPLTIKHREKFARYGDPKDKDNPSWLAR